MTTPTPDEQALTEQIEEAVRPVLLRRALMSDVDLPAYIAHAVLPIVKVRDARVRAEAVAPVLALHNADGKRWEGFPRADRRVTYCTHCQLAAPCPSVRAASIEQETQS